jgi:hypothetical protein
MEIINLDLLGLTDDGPCKEFISPKGCTTGCPSFVPICPCVKHKSCSGVTGQPG